MTSNRIMAWRIFYRIWTSKNKQVNENVPLVVSMHSAIVWTGIIAQVYRLSAVHCQMIRCSQRVPGYLTRYSVSANETSFDKKIRQSDCVFQIRLGLEDNDSPLHLVTSTGFLKA